jgi:hypothetical protein
VVLNVYILPSTSSGQCNRASWASQTSEVGYTSATTGRGDHVVHKGHVVALEKNYSREIIWKNSIVLCLWKFIFLKMAFCYFYDYSLLSALFPLIWSSSPDATSVVYVSKHVMYIPVSQRLLASFCYTLGCHLIMMCTGADVTLVAVKLYGNNNFAPWHNPQSITVLEMKSKAILLNIYCWNFFFLHIWKML